MKTSTQTNPVKILLISASPHKKSSSSFALAQQVVKGFPASGVICQTVHLHDYKISFCHHCDRCHKRLMDCPIKDDAHLILKKMLDADGIILATPNYINNVPAIMKALFDRSSHFIHCQRLLGKYIFGVVSSGSGQDQTVLDYLKHYSNTCGAMYSGGVSAGRMNMKGTDKAAQKLGREFITDIHQKNTCPKQEASIRQGLKHFCNIITARKNEWAEEYQYWSEKGWI